VPENGGERRSRSLYRAKTRCRLVAGYFEYVRHSPVSWNSGSRQMCSSLRSAGTCGLPYCDVEEQHDT
jgi:hypothetical protein